MDTPDTPAGPPSRTVRLRVWDVPTRLFHWALVVAVTVALATGFLAPAWWLDGHVWAGYGVAALLVFRVVWAFFGSEYSRLDSFAFSPAVMVRHLRDLFSREPHDRHIGHNPAGAAMIFVLAGALAALVATGFVQLGGVEKQGPLATVASYAAGAGVAEIHEVLAVALLALVVAHVAGVFWESRRSRENLAAAMVSGDKAVSPDALPIGGRTARAGAATAVLAGLAAVAGGGGWALSQIPPRGLAAVAANPAFEAECADCHQLYHPSLLPAADWRALMAGLDNHFGEDASLSPATAAAITEHLARHAAERWDTKAAHLFRPAASARAGEISATLGWLKVHASLRDADFATPKVKNRSNCAACHGDAAAGTFADQSIHIPKGDTP